MNKNRLISVAGITIAGFLYPLSAATILVDADITSNTTWTSDNEYILTKIIYVKNNATLTIQAGTVIKGEPDDPNTTEKDPGTLVITTNGMIMAEGTSSNPIIFTATVDTDPKNTIIAPKTGQTVNQGYWGGLIVLGRAPVNTAITNKPVGTNHIEGIEENNDTLYGGNLPNDNSGVIKYVSIRHGGSLLGTNNEINGLTLGGVGFGTVIDYVEVYCNLDDGYEWFGGTVACRWLVSAYNDDDCFDWDEGFSGLVQFAFGLQGWPGLNANRMFEMDGGTVPETGRPYSVPTWYNVTMVGNNSQPTGDGSDVGLKFRDNSGGFFFNSIFTEGRGTAVSIEQEGGDAAQNSEQRLADGELGLYANIFWNFNMGSTPSNDPAVIFKQSTESWTHAHVNANNTIVDPFPNSTFNHGVAGGINPRPSSFVSAVTSGLTAYPGRFFTPVNFKGAFNPNPGAPLWTKGWTALNKSGYLVN